MHDPEEDAARAVSLLLSTGEREDSDSPDIYTGALVVDSRDVNIPEDLQVAFGYLYRAYLDSEDSQNLVAQVAMLGKADEWHKNLDKQRDEKRIYCVNPRVVVAWFWERMRQECPDCWGDRDGRRDT